jgi:hypothetical protein
MNTILKNVDGHYYPEFHCGWGGCSDELFYHTSRYYIYTEIFLRNLSGNRNFTMAGYKASLLSTAQRELMAAALSCRPDLHTAKAINSIVTATLQGKTGINDEYAKRFRQQLERIPKGKPVFCRSRYCKPVVTDVSPIDPFLSLAERLQIPVAIRDHHVEVSLKDLALHLDSPNPRLRVNLQEAVLRLHEAGYLLRNHPGLTHKEARSIADEDAV